MREDPDFLYRILWTDEASLSTAGEVNKKNLHYWSRENPRKTYERRRSGRRTVGVWCGMIRNRIIGPFFYNGNLDGRRYLNMLQTDIENGIDDLPLNMQNLIWQQDGAPPHNTLAVRDFLNENYPIWLGTFGTIPWSPNSPDLNPPDIWLWNRLKEHIYTHRPNNLEEIKNRAREIVNYINNTQPHHVINTIRGLRRRYELCIERNGDVFEHLLD